MQLYQVGMMMPFCPQTQQDDALLFTFSNAFYILRNISKNYTASRLDKQSMFVFFLRTKSQPTHWQMLLIQPRWNATRAKQPHDPSQDKINNSIISLSCSLH
jgi:hypothetical protein